MSLVTFAFLLAILSLGGATPAPEKDRCKQFLQDDTFTPESLVGIWKTVYAWSGMPQDITKDAPAGAQVAWHYTLTPGEVTSYSREMSDDFPSISWDNIKYSWNLATLKYEDSPVKFLLEVEDGSSGDVTAIPTGEVYSHMKRSGADMTPRRYRFKTIGNYLAVMSCETNHAYLLHKGFEDPSQADVEVSKRLFTSVTDVIN